MISTKQTIKFSYITEKSTPTMSFLPLNHLLCFPFIPLSQTNHYAHSPLLPTDQS